MPNTHRPHFPVRRLVLGVLSSLALISLFAFVSWGMAQKDYDRSKQSATNVLSTMSRDIARSLETYSLSLDMAAEAFADEQVMALDDRIKRLVLFDRAATQSDLGSIFIIDPVGNVVIESRPGGVDDKSHWAKDYFRIHQLQPDYGLYVSRPLSTSQGEQWIALSQRIVDKHGTFLGVAVGTVKLSYFRNLFSAVRREPGQTLAISYDDGTLLLRVPYDDKLTGRRLGEKSVVTRILTAENGSFDSADTPDGVRRLYAFQKVTPYPLVLSYGVSFDEIYRDWTWQTGLLGLMLALLSAASIGMLVLLARELQKRVADEKPLRLLANTDALTGLANRRSLDAKFYELCARASLENKPLAVVMIDADHFKQYNDRYGHVMGDFALRTIAKCIVQSVRPTDLVARYGGEEFAILMPNTSGDQARDICFEIRRRLTSERSRLAADDKEIPTVSIGIAAGFPQGNVSEALLRIADGALYEAKRRGRDCIEIGSAPARQPAAA